MSSYGRKSTRIFSTLHPIWQEILTEAIKSDYFDHSLIEGTRAPERQNELYASGESKAKAGESAHNYSPSFGVDIIPHPLGYADGQFMLLLAGHIIGVAEKMGYKVTNGSDWDRDGMTIDTNFKDFWHFELTDWRKME